MKFTYTPSGTCSRKMEFEISGEGIVTNVKITGGCPGNTVGVAKLAEGRKAEDIIQMLSGVSCGTKSTSCPDQLARGLRFALEKMNEGTAQQ